MNEGLENFLKKGGSGQAAADEPPVVADEPKGEPVATEAPKAPEPVAPVVDDEDGAPPAPTGEMVPTAAYLAERNKRQDWKAKANAADATVAELRKQLDEAKKQTAAAASPPAPAAPPQSTVAPLLQRPNALEDPEGAAAFDRLQVKLDVSEEMLRDRHGDEAVDEALAVYRKLVTANPVIHAQCLAQRNPYKWMFAEVKRAQAAEKIGNDPDAYAAKLRADIRAEIEAELAGKALTNPPPVAQRVPLPRSLANATSAAPRSAPAWTGPTPLGQILKR